MFYLRVLTVLCVCSHGVEFTLNFAFHRQYVYCKGYYVDKAEALVRDVLKAAGKDANKDALTVVLPIVSSRRCK